MTTTENKNKKKEKKSSSSEPPQQEEKEKEPENKEELELDENDISLQVNPIELVLRYQCIIEAISALKEKEILNRISLIQLYHEGFSAIVRHSMLLLHLDSTALSTVQARQILLSYPYPVLNSTHHENKNRNKNNAAAGDVAADEFQSQSESESNNLRKTLENDLNPTVLHLQRLRSNNLRRMYQELHDKQQQVSSFAANELRRTEATRRREEKLAATTHDNIREKKYNIMQTNKYHLIQQEQKEQQRRESLEAKRRYAQAHALHILEKRKKRQKSMLKLEEEVQTVVKESRDILIKGILELKSTAAYIHELHRERRLRDVGTVTKELQCSLNEDSTDDTAREKVIQLWLRKQQEQQKQKQSQLNRQKYNKNNDFSVNGSPHSPLLSSKNYSPFQLSYSHHKNKKSSQPISNEEYIRLCGSSQALIQPFNRGSSSIELPITDNKVQKLSPQQIQQSCTSPIVWH